MTTLVRIHRLKTKFETKYKLLDSVKLCCRCCVSQKKKLIHPKNVSISEGKQSLDNAKTGSIDV